MENIQLEQDYRAACQRMLVSLDLRAAINRMNEEIARLHKVLTVEGAQILEGPANDESLQRYKTMVLNVVAKLDERDQLRQKDGFKDALNNLLNLGEQLGYARKDPDSGRKPEPAPALEEKPLTVIRPQAPPPTAHEDVQSLAEATGFRAVEKELAELQSQLANLPQD